jgi:hypothetical protein
MVKLDMAISVTLGHYLAKVDFNVWIYCPNPGYHGFSLNQGKLTTPGA